MKTIEQLRNKYWSAESNLPWPRLTSPQQLEVRYNRDEYAVDVYSMNKARLYAHHAVMFHWLGQDQKAERAFNVANSYLAGAMQVDGFNVAFWEALQ